MSASIDSFYREMMPVLKGLKEARDNNLNTQASMQKLGDSIQSILTNANYNPHLNSPERAILNVLRVSVASGHLSNMSARVDHLSKLICQNLMDKDPFRASELAMKIDNAELRESLLYESLGKLPFETSADFDRGRKIVETLKDPTYKTNALYRTILTPLYKKYEETQDVAYLKELWQTVMIFPKDIPGEAAKWRAEAFLKFAGYMSEREDMKAVIVNNKLSFEHLTEPADRFENEKLNTIRKMLGVFKAEKAGLPGIVFLIDMLPDRHERYALLKSVAVQYERQGNQSDAKQLNQFMESLLIDIVTDDLRQNNFRDGLMMVPILPKPIRVKWEAALLKKADEEIKRCIAEGTDSQLKEAKKYIDQFKIGEAVPVPYRDQYQVWNKALSDARY